MNQIRVYCELWDYGYISEVDVFIGDKKLPKFNFFETYGLEVLEKTMQMVKTISDAIGDCEIIANVSNRCEDCLRYEIEDVCKEYGCKLEYDEED